MKYFLKLARFSLVCYALSVCLNCYQDPIYKLNKMIQIEDTLNYIKGKKNNSEAKSTSYRRREIV